MTVLLGQQTRSSNRQIVTDGSRLASHAIIISHSLLVSFPPFSFHVIPCDNRDNVFLYLSDMTNFISKNAILDTASEIMPLRKKACRNDLYLAFVLLLYTHQIWFISRVRYNGERGEYKRGAQTALKLTNSLDCAKSADGKAAWKKPVFLFISTLLQNAWDISGVFLYIMHIHTRTYMYIRANILRTVHRSALPGGPSSRLLYCSVGCFATA